MRQTTGKFLTPTSPKLLFLAIALSFHASWCAAQDKDAKSDATTKAAVDAAIQAIKSAGEPVTLSELNAWYPEPPTDKNAAPLYADAFALVENDSESPNFVSKNQKALELLHLASARSSCRFPVDLSKGWEASLPPFGKMKVCGLLLRDAAIQQARKGRSDAAAESCLDGLGLIQSLAQVPMLISQLVRFACVPYSVSAAEQCQNLKPFTELQLVSLQSRFRKIRHSDTESLVRSLITERCMAIAVFQSPPEEAAAIYRKIHQIGESAGLPSAMPDLSQTVNHQTLQSDLLFYLTQVNLLIAAAKNSFPKALDQGRKFESNLQAENRVLPITFMASLPKAVERAAMAAGYSAAAEAGLAVERFRIANHDSLPTSLDQLVPKYLQAVPADPFDAKPIRLKKLSPAGFATYSIGPNLQDDDATPKPPSGQGGATSYDLTFTVKR